MKTPILSKAILHGSKKIAIYLINNGADINLANQYGKTPLMYATMFKRIKLVKVLLEHNADINKKTLDGKTALDYATFINENPEKTKIIIEMLKNKLNSKDMN